MESGWKCFFGNDKEVEAGLGDQINEQFKTNIH